ncbi:MAG: TrpR-like protein, YerC/YecD [Clostridia bacterium]|nr:TrpR-like protein, YerC/YecD [Clostridia bacterium]
MLEKLNENNIKMLAKAFLSLETVEEFSNLLEDLCTISEIKAMAQRIEVAQMLCDRVVYSDIVRSTGASTATISRVNRALNYGAGGYKTVLARMNPEEK